MVWRRRNVESVRLGIIADHNCVLEFSGLSMPFLRSAVLEIAVCNYGSRIFRSKSANFAVRNFGYRGPQLWL
jgi:hypothetical protein